MYLPGDVILKQGDEGSSFFFIISGYANVVRENKDMKIHKFHELASENLTYNKQQTLFQKIINKVKGTKFIDEENLERIQRIATI